MKFQPRQKASTDKNLNNSGDGQCFLARRPLVPECWAESLITIKDIEKVTITNSDNIPIIIKTNLQESPSDEVRTYRYPLYYNHTYDNGTEYLGYLEITAPSYIKADLYKRIGFFVLANLLKPLWFPGLFFWSSITTSTKTWNRS